MTEDIDVNDAIGMAIRMEQEGHAFYTRAAARTSSDTGRRIFEALADDEMVHLETFRRMFDGKVTREEWDRLSERTRSREGGQVFPTDVRPEGVEADTDDLSALRIGMESEQRAIDHYTALRDRVDDGAVAAILDEIIAQERSHYVLLEEEFTHLSNTGFWHDPDYLGERAF